MNQPCLKLTAYFAERQRAAGGGRFLADSMFDLFSARDIATSVMLRGIASFGPSHSNIPGVNFLAVSKSCLPCGA